MRPIKRVEVCAEDLESILELAKTTPLTEEECAKLHEALKTLMYLTDLVGDKDTIKQNINSFLMAFL
jgi:hypothetical protein